MCLGILLVHEMRVVGGYDLNAVFACHLHEEGIHSLLFLVYVAVSLRLVGLVALQLQIVVFAEHALIP